MENNTTKKSYSDYAKDAYNHFKSFLSEIHEAETNLSSDELPQFQQEMDLLIDSLYEDEKFGAILENLRD